MKIVAIAAGAVSALMGISVMIGWYTHTTELIQIRPTFVPMQFNTATGFFLSGLMLMTIGRMPRVALSCAALVATIAVLTLLEYALGVDFGIDQFLWQHDITIKSSHPGRMAPNTAICFALTGAAILLSNLLTRKWAEFFLGIFGSIVLGLSLVSLSGYLVGLEGLYGWGRFTQMALHTTLGFIVVGMGLLMLAWSEAPNPRYLPGWTPILAGTLVLAITTTLYNALRPSVHIELAHNLVFFYGVALALLLAWVMNRYRLAQILAHQLMDSEERLRFTLESTSDGFWDWNMQTGEVIYSGQLIDMFGFKPHESEPRLDAWEERIHPQDRDQIMRDMNDHLEGKSTIFQAEFRIKSKAGAWMWVLDRGKIIAWDENGKPQRAVGTYTDINERKQAELALEESNLRYQRLFNDSPISLWVEDFSPVKAYLDELKATGITNFRQYFDENPDEVVVCSKKVIVLDVNQATVILHEAASKQDLLGRLNTTFTENSMDVFKEALITLAAGRRHFESDVQLKTLSGSPIDTHAQFSVMNTTETDVTGLLAFSDLT